MSNNYLVITKFYDPFPKELRQTIPAANPGLAVNRAFKAARKTEFKGKRVKMITFVVSLLGKVSKPKSNESES